MVHHSPKKHAWYSGSNLLLFCYILILNVSILNTLGALCCQQGLLQPAFIVLLEVIPQISGPDVPK